MDPDADPEGPKTYGSYESGSGSTTLVLKPEIKMHLEPGECADSRRREGQSAGFGGRRRHPRVTGDSRPGKQPALKIYEKVSKKKKP
jgi:hypothetical protein